MEAILELNTDDVTPEHIHNMEAILELNKHDVTHEHIYKMMCYLKGEQKCLEKAMSNNDNEAISSIFTGGPPSVKINECLTPECKDEKIIEKIIFWSAKIGNKKLLKYLLDKDVNINININMTDNGTTLLHYACKYDNLEIVQYLIEDKGVDISIRDSRELAPLHIACKYNNNLQIVKYLIEDKGVDICIRDGSGFAPLHIATAANNLQIVQYLIEKKNVDINLIQERPQL